MKLPSLAVCLVVCVLSGCTTTGVAAVPRGRPTPVPSSTTTAAPTPAGGRPRLVASSTVLDSGSGPELCAGLVLQSLPPQCGTAVPLTHWTWPAGSEHRAGVRWGDYAVVGTYDGQRLRVEKTVDPASVAGCLFRDDTDLRTRCTPPAGGWRAPDALRATHGDQDRALTTATHLPGFGGLWVDDQGHPSQDPVDVVLNVQVTDHVVEATQTLRRVWGGSLCVIRSRYTESELLGVQQALMRRRGSVFSTVGHTSVAYTVVYDDGRLQRRLDRQYGVGLVRVGSVLQPYRG